MLEQKDENGDIHEVLWVKFVENRKSDIKNFTAMPTNLVEERSLSGAINYFSSLSLGSIIFLRSLLAAQFCCRCTHTLCGADCSACSPMYILCNRSEESLSLLESLGVSKDEISAKKE